MMCVYTHTHTHTHTCTHAHTHTHTHTHTAPSQPPTGLQISCISSSEATLMWTPPPFISHNGILTDYVITYQCSSNNLWQQCSREQINVAVNSSNITTYVVKGLTPFTLYSFQIAAETAVGRGPFSDSLSCTTQQDGKSD